MHDPIVKLPTVGSQSKSGIGELLLRGSQVATIIVGVVVLAFVLHVGRPILAPVVLAMVIGMMFGPIADRLEQMHLRPAFSALFVVILFLAVMIAIGTAFSVPLAEWVDRIPQIWAKLREAAESWRNALSSIEAISTQLENLSGDGGVPVRVDDGNAVFNVAFFAPELLGQSALFLASLYFLVATRHQLRAAILKLCLHRRLRWRVAHIIRDTEGLISQYLLVISAINIAFGTVVSLAMYAIGAPSALLWGLLAAVTNYVVYIGPAVMIAILIAVGIATYPTMPMMLAPAGVYLALNFIESQFITPNLVGRKLTLNPFIVFLTFVFWLWLWGPIGGFVATPLLLSATVVLTHITPLMPTEK